MKEVLIRDDEVMIRDWVGEQLGTIRSWSKTDWDGWVGDLFRAHHRVVFQQPNGVLWFEEIGNEQS